MSKSYKKNTVSSSTSARSEKEDKRIANRSFRGLVKHLIKNEEYDLASIVTIRENTNVWDFAKDGKHWLSADRINKAIYRKIMGK